MLFCPENYEDIHRYYRNTYVKFPERGDELFYINNVDRYRLSGIHESGDEFELFYSDEKPYNVEFVIPRKSFFQYKNRAFMLQRLPAKQYKRGISDENTNIFSLTTEGRVSGANVGFELLKAYVSKQAFPSFDKAITSKGRIISVAMSPRFAYVPKTHGIYADAMLVAKVDHPALKVRMIHNVFGPEIREMSKDSKFEVQYA